MRRRGQASEARRPRWPALMVLAAVLALAAVLLREQLPPPPAPPAIRAAPAAEVDFAGGGMGYALIPVCRRETIQRCRYQLGVSHDGGLSWTRRPTPLREFTGPQSPRLTALGGGVLVQRASDIGQRGYFSSDGGRRWSPLDGPIRGCVRTIPDGAVLRYDAPEVVVVLPDTGRQVALANLPALEVTWVEPIPVNGAWWLTGRLPDTGVPATASSRDGGRTWTVAPLPLPPDEDTTIVISGAALTHYATVRSRTEERLIGIYRAGEPGRGWELAYRPGAGPGRNGYLTVVLPDGRVVVLVGSRVGQPSGSGYNLAWLSTDRGRSFGRYPELDRFWMISPTRSGYMALSANRTGFTWHYSTYGVTWRQLDFGVG